MAAFGKSNLDTHARQPASGIAAQPARTAEDAAELRAGEEESRRLDLTHKAFVAQNVILAIVLAFLGGTFDHLLPFTYKRLGEEWVASGLLPLLALTTLVIAWRLYVNGSALNSARKLAPTHLYSRLNHFERDCTVARRDLSQCEAWIGLQHILEQKVFLYEQRVYAALAAMRAERLAPTDVHQRLQADFMSVLDDLVGNIADGRGELLGYEISEVYFFDVFEVRGEELYRIARRCPPHRSDGTAVEQHDRHFHIGDGDVGDCVYRRKSIWRDYSIDPQDTTSATFRPSDAHNFQCRLSTPIFAADSRPHSAFGAFCFTSSDPKRLLEAHSIVVENLSQPVAAMFARREAASQLVELYRQELDYDAHHRTRMRIDTTGPDGVFDSER